MSTLEPEALIRIGEISRRTGVRPDSIRAWERRYGLLDPLRSSGGYRLYSATDEAVLQRMRELTGQGLAAAEAAEIARTTGGKGTPSSPGHGALDPSVQASRLRRALEAFDEPGADAILDESLAGLSLDRFVEGVVLVAMAEIGTRWESGAVTVAQEHFASALVRGRLLGLARGWGAGSGPLAVLACIPGELHDLGLISFGLCLRERGWRILYLGADTPPETLEETIASTRPDWVMLAASRGYRLGEATASLRPLAEMARVGIGGGGIDWAGALNGITLLPGGAAEEAESLSVRIGA